MGLCPGRPALPRDRRSALRYARFGLAKVFSVDPGGDICTWMAARASLVLTGTRHFVTIGKVLEWAGIELSEVGTVPGAFTDEAQNVLQLMGADVTAVSATGTVPDVLIATLGDNPNAVAMFSVKWTSGVTAKEVGHTMVAFRNALTGALQILDRSGNIVSSLADLESVYSNAPGISNAVLYDIAESPILLIRNSSIVTVLENGLSIATLTQSAEAWLTTDDGSRMFSNGRWIYHAFGLEVRSVPFRVETHAVVSVPIRPVLDKASLKTQTFCAPTLGNSDTLPQPPSCEVWTVYTVESGDTLSDVANLAYGAPQRWRGIAAANGITDPTRLRVGALLLIP